MKSYYVLVLTLVVFMMGLTACGGSGSPTLPSQPAADQPRLVSYTPDSWCGDQTIVNLIAGQNFDAGQVIVSNDEDYLYVDIVVDDPWVLIDNQVAVADSLDGIPQTRNGNPIPGKFPYTIGDPIPLNWECGTELYVAVHAVVQMLDENGEIIRTDTGWGEGPRFNNKQWAMYFMSTVQCCPKDILLPDVPVGYSIVPGTESYITSTLFDVPAGDYTVWDGEWLGWCADKYHYIYYPKNYTAMLYSTGSPHLFPNDSRLDQPWDKINYILNHKKGTAEDIQSAFWYYTDGETPTPIGQELIDEADEFGVGYKPGPGEWIAVICYVGPNVQITFIEVDP